MSDEVFDPYDLSNYSKSSVKDKIASSDEPEEKPIRKRKFTDDEDLPQNIDLTKNAYKEANANKLPQNENSNLMGNNNFLGGYDDNLDEEEIPLLEDLGVNLENIKQKIFSILTFKKIDKKFFDESDMAGPFFIICFFSITLMLQKKTCFGYLYGISVLGSVLVFLLLNLMSKNNSILLYNTISILGYSLLPVVFLSLINVFFNEKNIIQVILCLGIIILCSISATRFFEISLEMQKQRFLIFYPVALFYACFVLVTVF